MLLSVAVYISSGLQIKHSLDTRMIDDLTNVELARHTSQNLVQSIRSGEVGVALIIRSNLKFTRSGGGALYR